MNRSKLGIVVSHPIQHFCPQYSSWAGLEVLEVKVFFASRHGLEAYFDKSFGREIKWPGLKLDFEHEFLPGAKDKKVGSQLDCPDVVDSLADFDPDIVLVYGYGQPLQRRAMRWAETNGKRLLMISDSELRRARSPIKKVIKAQLLPRVLSVVDLFLTVGDANEAYYRYYGIPDHKMVRTSFPIDIALFDQALLVRDKQRARIRQLLGLSNDQLMVLMVGKLLLSKRQVDLVEASNLLQPANSNITIVLAGTGPDQERLETLAQKKGSGGVIFAGFVPPGELVHYYSAADVYVHCSDTEAHSLAISEAIYAGLPVILSDRCGSYGPSDDVRIGLNGYVYPCGDTPALSVLLERLWASPKLRQEMGGESRQIGSDHQILAHGKAIKQAVNVLNVSG